MVEFGDWSISKAAADTAVDTTLAERIVPVDSVSLPSAVVDMAAGIATDSAEISVISNGQTTVAATNHEVLVQTGTCSTPVLAEDTTATTPLPVASVVAAEATTATTITDGAPPTDAKLSPDAPVFVPITMSTTESATAIAAAPFVPEVDPSNVRALLPPGHHHYLRGHWTDAYGTITPYYIGRLKTYSTRNGYGFLECKQSFDDYGQDVFIHKNLISQPWHIGQPVEFAVFMNDRCQPQAVDTKWLPRLPEPPKALRRPPPQLQQPVSSDNSAGGCKGSSSTDPGVSTRTTFGLDSPTVASVLAVVTSPTSVSSVPPAAAIDIPGPVPVASIAAGAATGSKEPRRVGIMKSFSPAQGYGFFYSKSFHAFEHRDVYFERAQLPSNGRQWTIGQTVEFSVLRNAKGMPQARSVDWDPVPQLPPLVRKPNVLGPPPGLHGYGPLPTTEQSSAPGSQRRLCHSESTIDMLDKFLLQLSLGDYNGAIVKSITQQADLWAEAKNRECQPNVAAKAEQADEVQLDTDLVSFVLDRLPGSQGTTPQPMKAQIRNVEQLVTKLLLVTILAKMLTRQTVKTRCQHHLAWLHCVVDAIDPHSTDANTLVPGVADTTDRIMKDAAEKNPALEDMQWQEIVDSLKAKAELAAQK